MKQIHYNGKMYHFDGKYFFDEFFIILSGEELNNVSRAYFNTIQYETLNSEDLFKTIKQMKSCGLYYETKKAIEFAIDKKSNDTQLLYGILPIYTSCCREAHQPKDAIIFAEKFLPICGGSSATYTSLAAAYCDIGDYENAKKCARRAYAKQGGGQGYNTEVSLVFKRIAKETGEELYEEETKRDGIFKNLDRDKKVSPVKEMQIIEADESAFLPFSKKVDSVQMKESFKINDFIKIKNKTMSEDEIGVKNNLLLEDFDVLQYVANSINPYTGESIKGIDESLKKRLEKTARRMQELNNLILAKDECGKKIRIQENNTEEPIMVGQKWTQSEESNLIEEFKRGLSITQIAKMHNRNSGGIRARLQKLGLIE